MLRCAELHLSKEDLDDMTMGMVFDMIIERGNDYEKDATGEVERATQADFDAFAINR